MPFLSARLVSCQADRPFSSPYRSPASAPVNGHGVFGLVFVGFEALGFHCFHGPPRGLTMCRACMTRPQPARSEHCANRVKIIGLFLPGLFMHSVASSVLLASVRCAQISTGSSGTVQGVKVPCPIPTQNHYADLVCNRSVQQLSSLTVCDSLSS